MTKILIVEDDTAIRETLTSLLELENYAVRTANNGKEALDLLNAPSDDLPDLILLDLMMPTMTGWEFLTIRETNPTLLGIPVIVLSAARDGLGTARANLILQKPLEIETLLNAIDGILRNTPKNV